MKHHGHHTLITSIPGHVLISVKFAILTIARAIRGAAEKAAEYYFREAIAGLMILVSIYVGTSFVFAPESNMHGPGFELLNDLVPLPIIGTWLITQAALLAVTMFGDRQQGMWPGLGMIAGYGFVAYHVNVGVAHGTPPANIGAYTALAAISALLTIGLSVYRPRAKGDDDE